MDVKTLPVVASIKKMEINEEYNPWAVSNATIFLKYCCPECETKCSELSEFSQHALNCHPMSSVLFEEPSKKRPKSPVRRLSQRKRIKTEVLDEISVSLDPADIKDEEFMAEDDDDEFDIGQDYDDDDEDEEVLLEPIKLKQEPKGKENKVKKPKGVDGDVNAPNGKYSSPDGNFSCYHCGDKTQFKLKTELADHWLYEPHWRSSKQIPELCQWCVEVFTSKKGYLKHVEECHPTIDRPPLIYHCHLCNTKLVNIYAMRRHQHEKHPEDKTIHPYYCKPCSQGFWFYESFLVHNMEKHGETREAHKCQYCPLIFHDAEMIRKHEIVHAEVRAVHFCHLCTETFTVKLDLAFHYETSHRGERPLMYKCNHCEKFASTVVNEVKNHSKKEHKTRAQAFLCQYCDKRAEDYDTIIKHQECHNKEKRAVCQVCGDRVLSRSMHQHMIKHSDRTKLDYVCDQCGFRTFSKQWLAKHVRQRHDIKKHSKCPYCSKTVPYKAILDKHIDDHHGDKEEKAHFCDVCKAGFIYETTLKHHKAHKCQRDILSRFPNKAEKDGQGVVCPEPDCGIEFSGSRGFYFHFKSRHSDKPLPPGFAQHRCDKCNSSFGSKHGMDVHLFRAHGITDKQKFCSICQLPFSRSHKCESYYKKPPEVRKKKCPECDMEFTDTCKIQEHVNAVHKNYLPFECSQCNKKWPSQRKLNMHVNIAHSKVKCELCGKSITNKNQLNFHRYRVHHITEGAFLCQLCPKKVFFTQARLDQHVKWNHKIEPAIYVVNEIVVDHAVQAELNDI